MHGLIFEPGALAARENASGTHDLGFELPEIERLTALQRFGNLPVTH